MTDQSSGMNRPVFVRVAAFVLGLIAIAWLRLQAGSPGLPGVLSDYATLLYVGLAVGAAVLLIRAGVPVRSLGFGLAFRPLLYLAYAAAGVGLLQLMDMLMTPVWERLFDAERDLTRFADVGGSVSRLMTVLAVSWTVAAFGEELTFRVLLMRGVAFALGDSRAAFAIALFAQAIVFGVIHAYQGPIGVAGTFMSGLIYGVLTLIARGSIWPAALAHGTNNTIGLLTLYAAG